MRVAVVTAETTAERDWVQRAALESLVTIRQLAMMAKEQSRRQREAEAELRSMKEELRLLRVASEGSARANLRHTPLRPRMVHAASIFMLQRGLCYSDEDDARMQVRHTPDGVMHACLFIADGCRAGGRCSAISYAGNQSGSVAVAGDNSLRPINNKRDQERHADPNQAQHEQATLRPSGHLLMGLNPI